MIRNTIVYFLFIILGIIIQSNVVSEVFLLKFAPDFLLIISIAGALKFKARDALLVAFTCGLVSDFATGQVVGPQAAGNLLACVLTQSFSKNVYANRFLSVALISGGAVIIKDLVVNLLINIFAPNDNFLDRITHLFKTMPGEVIVTALIAPILIKIVSRKIISSV